MYENKEMTVTNDAVLFWQHEQNETLDREWKLSFKFEIFVSYVDLTC